MMVLEAHMQTRFTCKCSRFAITAFFISLSHSNLHYINAGVPQGSVISPVLFILFLNDLLSSISSNIHSFADDTFLSSSFSFNPYNHASSNIQLYKNISASLLSNDLASIEKWDQDNLISFIQRTCHLWNLLPSSFRNPKICLLSNPKSINLS